MISWLGSSAPFMRSWVFWFFVLVLIFIALRIWLGSGEYEFIGLPAVLRQPLGTSVPSTTDLPFTPIVIDSNDDVVVPEQVTVCPDPLQQLRVARLRPLSPRLLAGPVRYERRGTSRGQQRCREIFERLTGASFPEVRPNFLRNPETGRNLELDGFNADLMLAFEYNGEQHYRWPNFLGQSHEDFIKQVRRDEYKREMCDRYGVYLIVVPYWVPHDQLEAYIVERLPENRNADSWRYSETLSQSLSQR